MGVLWTSACASVPGPNSIALPSTPTWPACAAPPPPLPHTDMFDLQRIMQRQQPKLSDAQQQNQTRWAVYQAASLLRSHSAEYEALQAAMARGASVVECIQAIEAAQGTN